MPAPEPSRAPAPAAAPVAAAPPKPSPAAPVDADGFKAAHASPSVRKFARELGVDLARVSGSGSKGRIVQEDVQNFVKQVMSGAGPAAGAAAGGGISGGGSLNLLPWPTVDFAKFGPVDPRPLSRIKKISARISRATG